MPDTFNGFNECSRHEKTKFTANQNSVRYNAAYENEEKRSQSYGKQKSSLPDTYTLLQVNYRPTFETTMCGSLLLDIPLLMAPLAHITDAN